MNWITWELQAKNVFSKNPIYGSNNRYFSKLTSPSYLSVIFAQLLYYMFFARIDHFLDNWDFEFFFMFWTRCLRLDWSRVIWVIKLRSRALSFCLHTLKILLFSKILEICVAFPLLYWFQGSKVYILKFRFIWKL